MSSLRIAKVTGITPGGYAVDLLFLDDRANVPGVQVLAPSAGTNFGYNDLAVPTKAGVTDPALTNDRDIYAVCAYVGRTPVVLGFLYPQVCQMLFTDMERRIDRHASDVYTSIDTHGNLELFHPSGTYMRIGTSPNHEDLTGKDFDKKWKIAKNTDKAVHVHLRVSNAGSSVASIDIDPDGNIVEQNNGNVTATIGGNVTATVAGNVKATVGGEVDVTASGSVKIVGAIINLNP
jgi:hypothetical protein